MKTLFLGIGCVWLSSYLSGINTGGQAARYDGMLLPLWLYMFSWPFALGGGLLVGSGIKRLMSSSKLEGETLTVGESR